MKEIINNLTLEELEKLENNISKRKKLLKEKLKNKTINDNKNKFNRITSNSKFLKVICKTINKVKILKLDKANTLTNFSMIGGIVCDLELIGTCYVCHNHGTFNTYISKEKITPFNFNECEIFPITQNDFEFVENLYESMIKTFD